MLRKILIGKIHRAVVTDADLQYMGSITLDPDLLDAAGILPLQEVEVWNVTNGERFTTYTLPGRRGSGEVILNGAAARRVAKGDVVIIAAYGLVEGEGPYKARVVFVGPGNTVGEIKEYSWDPDQKKFELC